MEGSQEKSFQKRDVAYKTSVFDVLNRELVMDGMFSHIIFGNIKVSRANIIATLVNKQELPNCTAGIIDDGTGRVLLKSFEKIGMFANIDIGDPLVVIGRIREFGGERYIMPEIVKKLQSSEWISIRKAELERSGVASKPKASVAGAENPDAGAGEGILSLIRELDDGNGAFIDKVIKMSNNTNADAVLNTLLENGDIFEVNPGKVKVLE
ncbi:hypothetical protein HYS31_00585 [Candidatus Woesearchaeota archaeon]|nr:hypothetical protein [Candidatus Woesearchaeota archaeon]